MVYIEKQFGLNKTRAATKSRDPSTSFFHTPAVAAAVVWWLLAGLGLRPLLGPFCLPPAFQLFDIGTNMVDDRGEKVGIQLHHEVQSLGSLTVSLDENWHHGVANVDIHEVWQVLDLLAGTGSANCLGLEELVALVFLLVPHGISIHLLVAKLDELVEWFVVCKGTSVWMLGPREQLDDGEAGGSHSQIFMAVWAIHQQVVWDGNCCLEVVLQEHRMANGHHG